MRARAGGYTLIEVLIAVTVFAVLAASAYMALNALSRAAMEQRAASESLAELQLAVARFDADLRQVTSRAVRSRDGGLEPALVGSRRELTATRAGWSNPAAVRRGQLQRFSWSLEQDRLVRLSWPVTDIAAATQPLTDSLLEELRLIEFRYRDGTGRWHDQWPPAQAEAAGLPVAVELNLDSRRHGAIRRLLVLEP